MVKRRKVSPGLSRLFILMSLVLTVTLVLGGSPARPANAGLPTEGAKQLETRAEVLVLRAYFRSAAERDQLAVEFDALETATLGGFLTIWGDRDAYNSLTARGLRVEIDEEATKQANNPYLFGEDSPDTFYGGYRIVEENYAIMANLAAAYPNLAEVVDIGDSWCKTHPGVCTVPAPTWNGFDLNVLHITNRNIPGPKPVFWFETGIHSRELAVPETATRMMNYLLGGYLGQGGYENNADVHWLVDYHDIWIMPHVNPDGHHMVEAGGNNPYSQRKNADRDDGCTTFPPGGGQLGTDLNRNFPFLWNCCNGSSGASCSETYRGPSAGSEEETQAVMNKIRSLIADQRGPNNSDPAPLNATGIYQSMHSAAALHLYPWGWTTTDAPNGPDLANIAKHMSATNANPPGNNYTPGQPPEVLYGVDGDTADWGYGELGIASYTTELASGGSFFPPYSIIDSEWNANRGGLLYQAKLARTPYLLTRGPDTANAVTNPMTVTQGVQSQLTASINYAWSNNTYSQNVSAAEYYIDTPPWAGGVAIPMAPTDGTFNSPTEAVQATIDTSSIPVGRHIIFVRGRGVNDYGGFGSWGPVMAAWLTVTGGGSPTPVTTGTPAPPTATAISTSTAIVTPTLPVGTPTCVPVGGTQDVAISGFAFNPQNLTVPAGTMVRWTNNDSAPHTSTSDTAVWDSGTLSQGGQYSFTFNTPGTYPYHCTLHPSMVGTITVQAAVPCSTSTVILPTSTRTNTAVAPTNTTIAATSTRTSTTVAPTNTTLAATSTRTTTGVIPTATRTSVPPTGTVTGVVASATSVVTSTSQPPTITVVASATSITPCTIEFTDVPTGDPFYLFIRCLACRGIISGYSDGTFRPNNPIIRGQIAKMVSNSAGYTESPDPQIYTDVPSSNPFYQWINRLSMRGHMGGYACGGPDEPCDGANNPYFRPYSNATRGQLSKIVSNTAGIVTVIPPGTQTYTDVPSTNPFWVYIERLTALGVMGGYQCGGPGEPCDGMNRPYFRPFAEVTRGQASKIVANTFFPGCETP